MNTVAIKNIDVKVWTQKGEFLQGNFLRSLTIPEITRQRTFELTDIEYEQIRDEIIRTERIEYNTSIIINLMNINDIEDFENL